MSKILKYVLALNYIILGVLVLFNRDATVFASFPAWARILFPILLIAYGAFRLYRVNRLENIEEE